MNECRLEAWDVTKVFPGTRALDQVQLQARPGEAHALCGENGAGRSILTNIIGGVFSPTEGETLFEGAPIAPRSSKEAQDTGIGFVHQELSLCPYLAAVGNIFIGRLPRKGGMIGFKRLWADADMALKQSSTNFPSSVLVSELAVSEQQIIEIAKPVSLNCKLLTLGGPTSSLVEKGTARLFDLVKELSDRGISILYIPHCIAEVSKIYDRVTAFRDGTYTTTMDIGDICADNIIRAMMGYELGNLYLAKSSCITANGPILEVNGLTGGIPHEVSLALRRGGTLGFAGLAGAGRGEVMRGLCTIDPIRSGQVVLDDRPCVFHTYRDAVNAGICYLTEDRKIQGLFLEVSIKNNMPGASTEGVSHGTWLDGKLERSLANRSVEQLVVKTPSIEYPINSPSGGNQQKCLIGKWLSPAPKVIIMGEPARGIDAGTRWEIHALLRQLAGNGVGVIVVSSELPEVIGVSDWVAVMHEGCLTGFLENEEVVEENIMKLASGGQLVERELRQ